MWSRQAIQILTCCRSEIASSPPVPHRSAEWGGLKMWPRRLRFWQATAGVGPQAGMSPQAVVRSDARPGAANASQAMLTQQDKSAGLKRGVSTPPRSRSDCDLQGQSNAQSGITPETSRGRWPTCRRALLPASRPSARPLCHSRCERCPRPPSAWGPNRCSARAP